MKKNKTDWFVFQPNNDEATVHASKKLAVLDAQSCGCTDNRPKKIHKGFYKLYGCSGYEYYIVAYPQMKENFLQLMQLAYEDAE